MEEKERKKGPQYERQATKEKDEGRIKFRRWNIMEGKKRVSAEGTISNIREKRKETLQCVKERKKRKE